MEVLEPYVHLTTANVRIIKNRTGPMGHTYGFIDLDSHAVSSPPCRHPGTAAGEPQGLKVLCHRDLLVCYPLVPALGSVFIQVK